jgi:hypothetical protein
VENNSSRELNPLYLSGRNPAYLEFVGMACFTAGLYEESISNMKKIIEKAPSAASVKKIIEKAPSAASELYGNHS